MHYTINQLRIFLAVTETGSVTKASEKLHLTQPAVSIQLRNFQNQFDFPLTEILGRKIYITAFGKEIANAAQNILEQINTIENKAHAYKGQLFGKLKISIVSTGKYVMPYFLNDFIHTHDKVELSLDVTNKLKVLESLTNNEVDFSLVSVLPENLNVDKIELMQNRMFVVTNTKIKYPNSLYDKSIFKKLDFIYREEGSGTRQIMEKFILKNNLPIKKKLELTSNEAVKQAIIAGLGCSIMPLIGIKNELQNKELQIIPVKGFPINSVWNLIWLKGKNHSPVAQQFLKYLKKEKTAIIKEKFDWFEKYVH